MDKEPEFITDKETEVKENPRHQYKLTYDEFNKCKLLQTRLWSDITVNDTDKLTEKIVEVTAKVLPGATFKELKSKDSKIKGWEIEYKKGRPFLYIYINTDDMRPMLIDQMRFDVTIPGSVLYY